MKLFSDMKARYLSWTAVVLCSFSIVLLFVSTATSADEHVLVSAEPGIQALQPGETLTYDVSWSRMLTAGTAVLEIKDETLPDGRAGLKFLVTGRSAGIVDKVYPVNDTVQSIFDPQIMESLSYSMHQNYNKKKRDLDLVFDHSRNVAVSTLNEDAPKTLDIPEQVQDGLSFLYYLRTLDEFTIGKVITINVLDVDKIWTVEVYTLGRETVKTPAGEFSTIKIKTRPLYKGVFQNKGEVFLWLTDDSRKVPVLMKSTLRVGSFVFTLTDMQSKSQK